MAGIKTVATGSYQACDVFGSTHEGKNSGFRATGVQRGSSSASNDDYYASLNSWPYQRGYPEGKAEWEIDAGNNYDFVHYFGGSSGRYLDTHVTGLTFRQENNSTAGHGVYIKRFGLELVNSSGSKQLWDLSGWMSRPGAYGVDISRSFNSDLLNALRTTFYINKFVVIASTSGGTGSRKTRTTIENLKFMTRTGPGGRLILPKMRNYSDRTKTNMIA